MAFAGLKVGVLALQGDFAEHASMLRRCGTDVTLVRLQEHLDGLDGLVIPGGESKTIGKLLNSFHLLEPVKALMKEGLPCFGTCAGCILLAKRVEGYEDMPRIGSMDIGVMRNAYGSQVDSFEADVDSEHWDGPKLHAVQIRAPAIEEVGENVSVIAKLAEKPVIVREGNMLACTFHPELTSDCRVHELFLHIAQKEKTAKKDRSN